MHVTGRVASERSAFRRTRLGRRRPAHRQTHIYGAPARRAVHRHRARDRLHRGVLAAGILLGIGMGGFFDGILFHQLLQWHPDVVQQDTPYEHPVHPPQHAPGRAPSRVHLARPPPPASPRRGAAATSLPLPTPRAPSPGRRSSDGACSTSWKAPSITTSWASTTSAPARSRAPGTQPFCSPAAPSRCSASSSSAPASARPPWTTALASPAPAPPPAAPEPHFPGAPRSPRVT